VSEANVVRTRGREQSLWRVLINTAQPGRPLVRGDSVNVVAHSLVLLRYEEPAA
jgi:hypothetical protein